MSTRMKQEYDYRIGFRFTSGDRGCYDVNVRASNLRDAKRQAHEIVKGGICDLHVHAKYVHHDKSDRRRVYP